MTEIKREETAPGEFALCTYEKNAIEIQETDPKDNTKNNPAYTFFYDGEGRIDYITVSIRCVVYKKQFYYYPSGKLHLIAEWQPI